MSNVKIKVGPLTISNPHIADENVEPAYDAVAGYDFYKTNGLPRSAHLVMPGGPSMTRQEFSDECDINNIMKQYEKHAADPMRSIREPVYVDFTTLPGTLMDAMNMLNEARDAFYLLPASVRREFDNDPAAWADYAADPANVEQMREWGLAKPAPVDPEPQLVRVVPEAPQEPEAPPKPPQGGSGGS